jgi:hypothetical protein
LEVNVKHRAAAVVMTLLSFAVIVSILVASLL